MSPRLRRTRTPKRLAPAQESVVEQGLVCELGGECCRLEGGRLFRCETYGRCCEADRREGESDRDWLRRTRPWVGAAVVWERSRQGKSDRRRLTGRRSSR